MIPVKILHTADGHAGYRQYGFAQRESDFYEALRQVVEKAIEHKVDAILIAGDLFDSTKPPALAVRVVQGLVKIANQHHIRVLGIDGNHDCCDSNWLRICGIEPLDGIRVLIESRDQSCGVMVGGINATRQLEFFRKVEALKLQGPTPILAIHQAVSELSGFPSDFTALHMATAFKPLGVQYCAMGDIHQRGRTIVGGCWFVYPGSTEVNDTSEDGDKSVEILTCDGQSVQVDTVPIKTRRFLIKTLESDADVDSVLLQANEPDKPFILGWYRADKRDIGKRAEALLAQAGCMFRIMPFSGQQGSQEIAQKTFERKGAMLQLTDAVTTFFEENTVEFQLVFQFLGNPDNAKEVARQYVKEKGA